MSLKCVRGTNIDFWSIALDAPPFPERQQSLHVHTIWLLKLIGFIGDVFTFTSTLVIATHTCATAQQCIQQQKPLLNIISIFIFVFLHFGFFHHFYCLFGRICFSWLWTQSSETIVRNPIVRESQRRWHLRWRHSQHQHLSPSFNIFFFRFDFVQTQILLSIWTLV